MTLTSLLTQVLGLAAAFSLILKKLLTHFPGLATVLSFSILASGLLTAALKG
jgi:hypothetical protein